MGWLLRFNFSFILLCIVYTSLGEEEAGRLLAIYLYIHYSMYSEEVVQWTMEFVYQGAIILLKSMNEGWYK